jgi:hypothetical protein
LESLQQACISGIPAETTDKYLVTHYLFFLFVYPGWAFSANGDMPHARLLPLLAQKVSKKR